jgi:hypothetical protein
VLPHRLSLRCGEKRVLDIRASRQVTLTNTGPVPVRVQMSRRSGTAWVPFCPEVRLEPGACWSHGAGEFRCPNLAVEVVCCAPP